MATAKIVLKKKHGEYRVNEQGLSLISISSMGTCPGPRCFQPGSGLIPNIGRVTKIKTIPLAEVN